MRNTTNYNLKLPEGPDKYNISDFNENTEMIDGELKKHEDAIADRYNKTEVDNKFSMHEMNVDWKESVDSFDDIATTYPEAENGWTVNVKDTNYTYRYSGTEWVPISANAIPTATTSVDGIMSKEIVKEHTKLCTDMDGVKSEIYKKIGDIKANTVDNSRLFSLVYCDGMYIGRGSDTKQHSEFVSSNLETWTKNSELMSYTMIAYSMGILVVSRYASNIHYRTPEESSYSVVGTDKTWAVRNIKGFDNGVIIMGDGIITVKMTDGISVRLPELSPGEEIIDIVEGEGGGIHWACTEKKIYKYTSLLDYSKEPEQTLFYSQNEETYSSVLYAKGTLYVTTTTGKILMAGLLAEVASGFEEGKNRLLYDNGMFFMQTHHNLYTSLDCEDWKLVYTSKKQLRGATVIEGNFIAYGDPGVVSLTPVQSLTEKVDQLNADLHNVTADFTTVTGTFITNSGFTNLKYPSGFKQDNCIVVAIEVLYESWRGGYGLNNANDPSRLFTILDPKEIRVYCNSTTHMVDKQFRVLLKKIGV